MKKILLLLSVLLLIPVVSGADINVSVNVTPPIPPPTPTQLVAGVIPLTVIVGMIVFSIKQFFITSDFKRIIAIIISLIVGIALVGVIAGLI